MREVWLRANPRVFWPGLAVLALVAVGGLTLCLLARHYQWSEFTQLIGLSLPIISLGTAYSLLVLARLPRLAKEGDELLVYLQDLKPIRVPLEIVEVFFKGQTTVQPTLPAQRTVSAANPAATSNSSTRASTIVVRLAEAAVDWQQRTVNPRLGKWEGGYIILYGTWCEPITGELLKSLNSRLVAAHRQRRGESPIDASLQSSASQPPCHPDEAAGCETASQCEATGQCEMLAQQLRRFMPSQTSSGIDA